MKYKVKLFLISFVFLQFFSTAINAKYVDGTIYLASGKEINCTIDLPIRAASKKVTFKRTDAEKAESIASDKIDMILLTSNDASVLIKRTKVENIKMKGTKVSKGKVWLEVSHFCENMISYVGIAGYDADRKGNLFGLSVDGMGAHYIQRTGEARPTEVGFIFAQKQVTQKAIDKQRKRKLVRYFSNDKEALSYFESKKRITESEIIEYIESNCEQKK